MKFELRLISFPQQIGSREMLRLNFLDLFAASKLSSSALANARIHHRKTTEFLVLICLL